jgi:hypothetical protein
MHPQESLTRQGDGDIVVFHNRQEQNPAYMIHEKETIDFSRKLFYGAWNSWNIRAFVADHSISTACSSLLHQKLRKILQLAHQEQMVRDIYQELSRRKKHTPESEIALHLSSVVYHWDLNYICSSHPDRQDHFGCHRNWCYNPYTLHKTSK